jgi:ribulose 1,5-bisphosphate carboxylase large subunit-like protein
MLADAHWMRLEPLIETCRPKGKTPPRDLRPAERGPPWGMPRVRQLIDSRVRPLDGRLPKGNLASDELSKFVGTAVHAL